MSELNRFWVSWACTSEDHRPLSYPPHKSVCGWWCSGYDADGNAILCAVVDAATEADAMNAVFLEWPEAELHVREYEWRFIESRPRDWYPGDRFPKSEWMSARLHRID